MMFFIYFLILKKLILNEEIMKNMAELKKQMLESKDISEAITYFFDLVEENRKIDSLNQRKIDNLIDYPDLCLAIDAAMTCARHILNSQAQIIEKIFIEMVQEKFYHGYCILSGTAIPMLILYCAEYQLGIASLANVFGKTHHFRFSLTEVPNMCLTH